MVTRILPVVSDHSQGLGGFQKAFLEPAGLACHVWALRGAFVAGRLTPIGTLLLLPTAIALARDGIGHGAFAASACGVLRLQARVEVGRYEALSKGSIPDGGDESEARGCVHW
jgi:hypothetical protein